MQTYLLKIIDRYRQFIRSQHDNMWATFYILAPTAIMLFILYVIYQWATGNNFKSLW